MPLYSILLSSRSPTPAQIWPLHSLVPLLEVEGQERAEWEKGRLRSKLGPIGKDPLLSLCPPCYREGAALPGTEPDAGSSLAPYTSGVCMAWRVTGHGNPRVAVQSTIMTVLPMGGAALPVPLTEKLELLCADYRLCVEGRRV